MEFKDRIKQIREENGLSQRQMAEKLYLTRSVISKWENGTRYPNYQEMDALRKMFDVSIDSLFSNDDVKQMPEVEPILQQNPEITVQSMLLMGILVLNCVCFMIQFKDFLNFLGNEGTINFEELVLTIYELLSVIIFGYSIYKSFNVEVTKRTIITVIIVSYFGHLLNLIISFLTTEVSYIIVLDFTISLLVMLYLLYVFMKSDYVVSKYPIIGCCLQIQIYLIELYGNVSHSFVNYVISNGLTYDVVYFFRRVLFMCFLIPQIKALTKKRTMKKIYYK